MSIPILIALVSLGTFTQSRDSSVSLIGVYTTVIRHAAPRYPSRPGVPVVVSNRITNHGCAPDCEDTTLIQRRLPTAVVKALKAKSLIVAACTEPEGMIGCESMRIGETFIRLGVPFRVAAGLKVRPGVGSPSAILGDGGTEPVDVGVDILVYGPCPPERSPCEFPDIVMFRYYLRELPDHSYIVVAAMETGAV